MSDAPTPQPAIGTEPVAGGGVARRTWTWFRRLHFLLGLYLLLFVWLFSISGLLLNHPGWEFTHDFWEQRQESTFERPIAPPPAAGDLAVARELMRQLGVAGEITEIERNAPERRFRVRVGKPGRSHEIDASFATGTATVKRIEVNAWGVLSGLHTFSGVSISDPARERDWVLTRLWSLAMDAVALGLVVLVLSGLYLWYRLKKKRLLGSLALASGAASCAFFLLGLFRFL